MITVSSLSKTYGGTTVVDNLDFEVKPGIVTGFLGPNGAGKSTTMRMIVGLDQPTQGEALIDGKPYSAYDKPLHKVGTLLDAKWVHPNRSARAHLEWIAASNGISRARVDEVLAMVGLTEVAKRKAGKYSLGMGQRLGLAAAMLGDPEVLILDEPVNGLDPEGIRWVRDFVRALAKEGRTVLISSHLLSEMSMTADHLVVIGKGKMVANTSTHDFTKNASEVSTVVRADDLDALRTLLSEESVTSVPFTDEEGRPSLKVPGKNSDWIGELAFSGGILLRELAEVRPSLEDAFMRMTGNSVEYHASSNGQAPQAQPQQTPQQQAQPEAPSRRGSGGRRGGTGSVPASELLKKHGKEEPRA
ncbi:ABC transporter ATP-binding protein [Corynebacterium sp. 320]|uniref:ABC transporter ATP-binding protein n=1 Tax=Corynebacterium zhongnanshanii TaxID=2768834 RepID=A0ABQ6VD34_9CORY|nr:MULTISPECIES: ABC transporter ATP-binding protein [Corynebacterium]KAB1503085.1 ABC transporter ATP-binding protein [Corynebacterium sp. 320]KAB1551063.1 ABC transporter ATP-binding protein [Corynebacterium sp. 319]KAB3519879.1 ABC transporter ATP-binding protein [Corynebacterium zhongnanshanii]KAB3526882.1 ABC transporter ATP-binding protein [Corynebacterium sp. 250]KAB3538375.1 ABC transporter ATP-binding protein [Corynebacterium sp. 366]